ncbi:hypothetical protein DL89DRAFT_185337, partial [Linderina pennispora]
HSVAIFVPIHAGTVPCLDQPGRAPPILTLAVTNGVLGGAGDLLAQSIENRTESTSTPFCWDTRRTIRFVTWGAICAPVLHKWYLFLNNQFPLPALDTSKTLFASAVAKRVAADQLVYAPLGIAGFFIAMNAMEGHGWRSAKHRLGELYAQRCLQTTPCGPLCRRSILPSFQQFTASRSAALSASFGTPLFRGRTHSRLHWVPSCRSRVLI